LSVCFCFLNSFVTNVPTTPSDAEAKLTEKGYEIKEINNEKDTAGIIALFIFHNFYREMPESVEDIIIENVTNVVVGRMESGNEGNFQMVSAIWFKTSEIAREVLNHFINI